MTTRRDFIQQLALLAAGAAALPTQVAAFEQYYNANTPLRGDDFIAIDEISLSGLAYVSTRLKVEFWQGDQQILAPSYNAFGGTYFWRASPDGKIIARPGDITWKMFLFQRSAMTRSEKDEEPIEMPVHDMRYVDGHIKYIRSEDMVRRTQIISTARGSVG